LNNEKINKMMISNDNINKTKLNDILDNKIVNTILSNSIKKGDEDVISYLLDDMDIEKYDFMKADQLLCGLLKCCDYNNVNKAIVKLIIKRWIPILKVEKIEEVITIIGGMISIPLNIFQYLLKIFNNISIYDILKGNLNKLTIPFSLLYDRLSNASNSKLSVYSLNSLLDIAKNNSRIDAISVLEHKISELTDTLIKPVWVNIDKDEEDLTYTIFDVNTWNNNDDDVPNSELLKQAYDTVTSNFSLYDSNKNLINDDTLSSLITIAIGQSNNKKMIVDDIEIDPDRIFGPLNPIIGVECISGIKGGCRMLSCCCRNIDQEDDEEIDYDDYNPTSWFSENNNGGNCDGCNFKIKDASYAIRYPVKNGGFIGCFCSTQCIEKKPPRDFDDDANMRLNIMTNTLSEKNIYDRVLTKKYPKIYTNEEKMKRQKKKEDIAHSSSKLETINEINEEEINKINEEETNEEEENDSEGIYDEEYRLKVIEEYKLLLNNDDSYNDDYYNDDSDNDDNIEENNDYIEENNNSNDYIEDNEEDNIEDNEEDNEEDNIEDNEEDNIEDNEEDNIEDNEEDNIEDNEEDNIEDILTDEELNKIINNYDTDDELPNIEDI
jgi:hypothetical protein